MNFLVDDHDRSETAGAEAADGFDGEHHVVGAVAVGLEVEFFIECVEEGCGAFDVTCGSVAEADDVFAFGLEGEVCVECGDAVDAGRGQPERACDIAQQFFGEPVVPRLRGLQDGYKFCFVVIVLAENFFGVLHARHGFCCFAHLF